MLEHVRRRSAEKMPQAGSEDLVGSWRMAGASKSARVGKFRTPDAAIASPPAAGGPEHDLARGKEATSRIIHAEAAYPLAFPPLPENHPAAALPPKF
jgi:hypothetical protein